MKKIIYFKVALLVFFVCFIVLFSINRNLINYKFYYFSLICSIGISFYFFPIKFIEILKQKITRWDRLFHLISLLIFYVSANLIAFISISENNKLEIICISLIILNFVYCIWIYFFDKSFRFRRKIIEHLILQTILILFNIFLI